MTALVDEAAIDRAIARTRGPDYVARDVLAIAADAVLLAAEVVHLRATIAELRAVAHARDEVYAASIAACAELEALCTLYGYDPHGKYALSEWLRDHLELGEGR
jgi:hypothetical protein